jgi:hypothetical protein
MHHAQARAHEHARQAVRKLSLELNNSLNRPAVLPRDR